MLILPPFFFTPAASLYFNDIGYFFLCLQRSYNSILILGQRFSALSLYYFDLAQFFLRLRRACTMLILHKCIFPCSGFVVW